MDTAALLAVLFGLLAAVGWGLGDFWSARAIKTLGPITSLFYINLIGVVSYALLLLIWRPSLHTTAAGLAYTLASGVFITTAASLFYKSLAAGPVSLVSPISGAYPLVSGLLAVIVFGARLSVQQIVAIVIIVMGVAAASGLHAIRRAEHRVGRGPLLALCAMALYGGGFSLAAKAVEQLGWQLPVLISWGSSLPILLLPIVTNGEAVLRSARQAFSHPYLVASAFIGVIGYICFNVGFSHDATTGTITIAVSACYPALTMILALKHFKEKITVVPLLGAIATIVGVVLLSIS